MGRPGDSDLGPARAVPPSLMGRLAVEAASPSGAALLTSKSDFGFSPTLSLEGGIQILYPIESSKPPGLCVYLAHGRDAVIVCKQHGMAFLLELLSALAHGLVSPLRARGHWGHRKGYM